MSIKTAPFGQNIADALHEIKNVLESNGGSTIYGFHVDSNESNPSSAVTYLKDAVGMTPAHMDFQNGRFDWGSWRDAFFLPRPCMLKSDGTVAYYLNEYDYTKKVDGTPSDIANADFDGNAMMEWGRDHKRIWYKIVPDDNDSTSYSVYIADHKADDDFNAWSFINKDNVMGEHFYTAIYSGSLIDGKLRSLSGKTLMANQNATNEIRYAKANSEYCNIQVWSDYQLVFFLLYLMGKSLDVQTVYGQGWTIGGSSSTAFTTGTTNDKGMFYGSTSTIQRIKVFGMEDIWGTLWNRCAGFMQTGGKAYYKLTEGTADGSSLSEYPLTAVAGMLEGGNVATSNNYIKKFRAVNGETIIVDEVGGSSSTYYCDHYYVNTGVVAFALLGGCSGYGASCGLCVYLSPAASVASWGIGAALSCKPLARQGELRTQRARGETSPLIDIYWDCGCAFALLGGYSGNGANCGLYVNLNNTASNANWNIGTAHSYPTWDNNRMHP